MMEFCPAGRVLTFAKLIVLSTAIFTSASVFAGESEISVSNRDMGLIGLANQDAPPVISKTLAPVEEGKFRRFSAGASDLAMHAMGLLGIKYRFGGNTPETGLDCSGFVRYVFKQALGATLPRTSLELSHVGKRVSGQELALGDLVFFRTIRNAVSHVGIYIGGNRFIHSPSAGGEVRVEDMDQVYWKTRFAGGRRVFENLPS